MHQIEDEKYTFESTLDKTMRVQIFTLESFSQHACIEN